MRLKRKQIVKWVCSECGTNNMSYKSMYYKCMVCNKIRTDEPLLPIKEGKIEDLFSKRESRVKKGDIKEGIWFLFEQLIFQVKAWRRRKK